MRILLLTNHPKDSALFGEVSKLTGYPLVEMGSAAEVCDEILKDPNAITVIDVNTQAQYKEFEDTLAEKIGLFNPIVNPNTYFFVADDEVSKYPYAFQSELFGNFLSRNFTHANTALLGYQVNIAAASLQPNHNFDITRFFQPGVKTQKIHITRSTQKLPIVDSMKTHMVEKLGFKMRAAALIASAVDELIMNAIFDAPTDVTGKYIYLQTPRSADMMLDEKSAVDFSIAFDGNILGVSVTDQFGSLDKQKLLRHIGKSYESEEFKVKATVAGAGLGLATVYRNCAGLVFECEPQSKTCVTIFFKKTDSFKDFKDQFRFLSTIVYFAQ